MNFKKSLNVKRRQHQVEISLISEAVTSGRLMVQHRAEVPQEPPRSLGHGRHGDGPRQRHPPGQAGYAHPSGYAGHGGHAGHGDSSGQGAEQGRHGHPPRHAGKPGKSPRHLRGDLAATGCEGGVVLKKRRRRTERWDEGRTLSRGEEGVKEEKGRGGKPKASLSPSSTSCLPTFLHA